MYFFKKKTLDSVLSGVKNTIKDLNDLVAHHHNTAQGHLVSASFHEDQAVEHTNDRDRARRIADKFSELLN